MKLTMCAVKDAVVGSFMQPFMQRNEEEAKRSFAFDIEQNAGKIPNVKDLQLFKLGEFDDESGEVVSKIEFLANAVQYIKKGEDE